MFSHARRDFAAFMCSVYKYTAFTVAKMKILFWCAFYLRHTYVRTTRDIYFLFEHVP